MIFIIYEGTFPKERQFEYKNDPHIIVFIVSDIL
jgi:hypothetical protein